jgi:excisionase family DNA binding protein
VIHKESTESERIVRYLSTAEAAGVVGVGRMTMLRWCKEGKIPCSDIGNDRKPRYRIAEADLHAYMESRKQGAAA